MPGRRQSECTLEVCQRSGRIQAQGALPGEHEESECRGFEQIGLRRVPCCSSQLLGRGVVIGEYIRKVLDPVGGLGFDPSGTRLHGGMPLRPAAADRRRRRGRATCQKAYSASPSIEERAGRTHELPCGTAPGACR